MQNRTQYTKLQKNMMLTEKILENGKTSFGV